MNALTDSEFVGKKDSFTNKGNKSFNSTLFNLFSAFGLYFILIIVVQLIAFGLNLLNSYGFKYLIFPLLTLNVLLSFSILNKSIIFLKEGSFIEIAFGKLPILPSLESGVISSAIKS